jgi:hypothetical protein
MTLQGENILDYAAYATWTSQQQQEICTCSIKEGTADFQFCPTHTHTTYYNMEDFDRNITYSIRRKYSKILLICLAQDWACARLSDILDSMYTDIKFLLVIFCYCSCTWLHNWSEEYSIWISPSSAGSGDKGPLLFFWSLHSWRSWCSRRQGVTTYNGWCTATLGGLLEHVPEICLFHWFFFLI